ncbi:Adrenodoxin mitochondrial [Spathaspora sp. JA1]|nr:Adrenodoxin mitochondrial [Spathaspora sp. JA1]
MLRSFARVALRAQPIRPISSRMTNRTIIAKTLTAKFHSTPIKSHGHIHKPKPGEELHITFITKDGEQFTYEVAEGDNILDIAQAHNLDMEGACGGSCACSTCHIIVDPDFYDSIPEPDDDENDMLDLAFALTETSRLGCQVKMTKELDGIRVALPAMTRNLQIKDMK